MHAYTLATVCRNNPPSTRPVLLITFAFCFFRQSSHLLLIPSILICQAIQPIQTNKGNVLANYRSKGAWLLRINTRCGVHAVGVEQWLVRDISMDMQVFFAKKAVTVLTGASREKRQRHTAPLQLETSRPKAYLFLQPTLLLTGSDITTFCF